jgi:P-type Mg2+ transporter
MSRPHPALIASSLVALGAALILVVLPLAASLGFVPMPGTLAITIVVIVATYLVCAEIAKHAADRPGGKP